MEFSEWITKKYVEWRGNKVGHGSTIADFAVVFGASQSIMSRWMRPGSKPPKAPKYLNALHIQYGHEFLEVMGINNPLGQLELSLLQVPPELQRKLLDALTDLNLAYETEGVLPRSSRALELAEEVFAKHGFQVNLTSKK